MAGGVHVKKHCMVCGSDDLTPASFTGTIAFREGAFIVHTDGMFYMHGSSSQERGIRMKDTDLLTTITGVAGAVALASGPVLQQVQPGSSMHPADWTQLAAAVFFAVLGFFSNKKGGQA